MRQHDIGVKINTPKEQNIIQKQNMHTYMWTSGFYKDASQFSEENIGFSTSDSVATGCLCAKINNWFTSCTIDKNKHNMNHRPKGKIKDNNTFGQKHRMREVVESTIN